MFCSDNWWFLMNNLGELVSNKLLVDAVTHCSGAKISCTVFFKTTTSQGKFICSHVVSDGVVCKLEQFSFQHKSPLLFFWYTQIKIVGDYVSYRFLSCHPSCGMQRGPFNCILLFLLMLFLLMPLMHNRALLFICTKIGKLIFSAVSCLFRHFAWFITS